MANTYTQLYFHVIFAVQGRKSSISEVWKNELYKYISGIIKSHDQKLMIVNGMPDHIHILLGTKPNCNLSDLIRIVKSNSSRWINENNFVVRKFEWQSGFGAFTVGQTQLSRVVNYIREQEKKHANSSFREEYVSFLKNYNINFNTEYLFKEFDN